MTASPLPTSPDPTAGPRHASNGLGRLGVIVAEAVSVVLVVAYTIFFVALAVGGDAAISDTWVGYLAGVALVGGLFASFVAFTMAVVARIRREVTARLWLPLALFPVLLAVVLLAEVLWME